MKIKLIFIGKTEKGYLQTGIENFENRLKHYANVECKIIDDKKIGKNLSPEQIKEKEGDLILKEIKESDDLILLDESGKNYTSVEFSKEIQKKMNAGRNICYIIGGPYGFSSQIYALNAEKIALSKMTFSHQMVRLIFFEQLYRAFTILKGEPYHHT